MGTCSKNEKERVFVPVLEIRGQHWHATNWVLLMITGGVAMQAKMCFHIKYGFT